MPPLTAKQPTFPTPHLMEAPVWPGWEDFQQSHLRCKKRKIIGRRAPLRHLRTRQWNGLRGFRLLHRPAARLQARNRRICRRRPRYMALLSKRKGPRDNALERLATQDRQSWARQGETMMTIKKKHRPGKLAAARSSRPVLLHQQTRTTHRLARDRRVAGRCSENGHCRKKC